MYNVAIVGCGGMGVTQMFDSGLPADYSFAGAVLRHSKTNLVALIDDDPTKLSVVDRVRAQAHTLGKTGKLFGYADLATAVTLSREGGRGIHIVCCAAGPIVNEDTTRRAEELGLLGVYAEKPLTLSLKTADDLVGFESSSPVKIQVNYLRNHCTTHLATLEHIRSGGIGELLFVRVLYKGGVLAVGPHAFSILNLLFGEMPQTVLAGVYSPLENSRAPSDPNIDGVLQYRWQDRLVNVSVTATGRGPINFPNDTYLFEFEFTGTRARISILENGSRTRYEEMRPSRDYGQATGSLMPYETSCIPLVIQDNRRRQYMTEGLDRLIAAIESGGETSCNARSARDAEEVAHALIQATTSGRPVALPLENRNCVVGEIKAGVALLREESQPKK